MSTLTPTPHIGRRFARYAVPSVLGMVATSLYTVVDGIFVGRGVGADALAAVNVVYPFIMLQIALSMLVAIGGANLYSQNRGRGDDRAAQSVFSNSIGMLAVIALVANVAALVFAAPVGRMLGADDALLPDVVVYLRWMALFGIVYMPGVGVSIFVRNDGAPGLEMAGTITGALTNIVLDWLFIMVYGWGVAGAAIASGIGQMVSVVVYCLYFTRKKRSLRVRVVRPSGATMRGIVVSGFASFLMEFSQSAITLSFNIVLMAHMGAPGVAAYSIVMYLCSMFNMVLIGMVQGAQPILSFAHGRGNDADERRIYRLGVMWNLILTTLFYGVTFLWGRPLAQLFGADNTTLIDTAASMMRLYFLGFLPIGVSLMNILFFQTTGREPRAIVVSALRCLGFVQLFLLILPPVWGLDGICLSLLCGELCNCAVSVAMFIRVIRREARQAPRTTAAAPR